MFFFLVRLLVQLKTRLSFSKQIRQAQLKTFECLFRNSRVCARRVFKQIKLKVKGCCARAVSKSLDRRACENASALPTLSTKKIEETTSLSFSLFRFSISLVRSSFPRDLLEKRNLGCVNAVGDLIAVWTELRERRQNTRLVKNLFKVFSIFASLSLSWNHGPFKHCKYDECCLIIMKQTYGSGDKEAFRGYEIKMSNCYRKVSQATSTVHDIIK